MNVVEATPPLRVLVVEHDDVDVELCLAALERGGLVVRADVVADRAALLERVASTSYDIVLADYRLPSWTGMEALATLRQAGVDIPFILVTGTLGDERAVECIKGGAADYIVKQNLHRLPIAVQRALKEHAAEREAARAEAHTRDMERELRERQARFQQFADNINEVFYLVDAQFRETFFVNRAYESVWGRSVESLYRDPTSFLEPIPVEDRERLLENIGQIQAGHPAPGVEFRVVRPDGEVRWVLGHASPVHDEKGNVYRLSGVALDITQRRRALLELQESEARLRKLTETAFDAIVISRNGRIAEASPGFLALFGFEQEDEVLGRSFAEFCTDDCREFVRHRIEDDIEGAYEATAVRRDGRTIHLEVVALHHVVDHQPARIAAIRDVSERHSLEAQFRQAQKMEAIGRLAGGVAHDFNNLLTVIGSYTELLLIELATEDTRRGDLEEIMRAVDGASSLTRQLLAFSRRQVVQPELLRLDEALQGTQKMLQRVIGEDVRLETVVGPGDLTVLIDPGQLSQVLMNLAVNARDAMPMGGRLTIELAQVELDESHADAQQDVRPGPYAMLAVSDTGVGMAPETLQRLFEPFFTTKRAGEGTGLGLATVYGIVKQGNGYIWVDSEPGAGATFRICLPLAREGPRPPNEANTADAAEGSRGTETILIAEDSEGVRVAAARILERHGYTVLTASGGHEALQLAAQETRQVDLLLADVVMPDMSGRELANRFQALRPGVKVVYMSGYTDDAILRHGIFASTVAYLQKPFTRSALTTKVRETLDA